MRQAVSKQDTRHLKSADLAITCVKWRSPMAIKLPTDQVRFLRQYLGGWRSGAGVNSISDGDVNALVDEYESCYP